MFARGQSGVGSSSLSVCEFCPEGLSWRVGLREAADIAKAVKLAVDGEPTVLLLLLLTAREVAVIVDGAGLPAFPPSPSRGSPLPSARTMSWFEAI